MTENQGGSALPPSEWTKLMARPPEHSSEGLGWKGLSAYRFTNPYRWQLKLPAVSSHMIVAHMANPCVMSTRWNGVMRKARSVPGSIMIMSAGQESWWEWTGDICEVQLHLDPAALTAAALEVTDKTVHLIDGLGIVDHELLGIAQKLSAELLTPGLGGRLFADAMSHWLMITLLRRHSTLRCERFERIDVPPHKIRVAMDYIETNLCDDVTLESIATAAGVSPFRFARGFKRATGRAPHQYVVMRRLEKAKELLRSTDRAIGDVARTVGFSTPSHFTSVFRRHCGATPRRFRENLQM